MGEQHPKDPSPATDSAITRPGGTVGERPAPHAQTPPNKPGQFEDDAQQEARSKMADAGTADEQTGEDADERAARPSPKPTRH